MVECKVRIIKEIPVYPKYQPKVGDVYDARYAEVAYNQPRSVPTTCVIDILGKKLMLRSGEFEIVRNSDGEGRP